MTRMRVEKKSGLMFKGRRVPLGGEIEVGTPREARLLQAIKAASPVAYPEDAPRQVAAILKAPSEQRGPLVERAPAELELLAEPLRDPVAPAPAATDTPPEEEGSETAKEPPSESSSDPSGTAGDEVPQEEGAAIPAAKKTRGRKPKASSGAPAEGAE